MCMGGKKSAAPAPAPVAQVPNPNNVADNSASGAMDRRQIAATQSALTASPDSGAKLGQSLTGTGV